MNIFKRTFIYILSTAIMLGTITSCADFIDIMPEAELPEQSVDFSRIENMYQPVIGVYSAVRSSGARWNNCVMFFTRDGDVWSGRTDDQPEAVEFSRHFNYTNSFWQLDQTWVDQYDIIRTANAALISLDGFASHLDKGSEDYKKYESYCGEVRVMRAWAYYNLVSNFGPVPIYSENHQTEFRRSSVSKIYAYIREDLEYAASKLPLLPIGEMEHKGAVSAFTAKALDARIYLLEGNYLKVEQLTDEIIDSRKLELFPDYYNLFKIPGKLCKESLFEIQTTDFGDGAGTDYIDVDKWFICQGPTIRSAEGQQIKGWGFIGYEEEFVDWARERSESVRFETSFLIAGGKTKEGYDIKRGNGGTTNFWNGKAYLPINQMSPNAVLYGDNNNVRVMRYAEVLLMNSEAKIRLGKNGDDGFNAVRKRANMPIKHKVTIDDVLDERRMELCCEWGIRYQDLLRTALAPQVLGSKGWNEDKTYWPIPFNQIEIIPDLKLDPIE